MFAIPLRFLLIALVQLALAGPAMAEQVTGLFKSERLVSDQSPEARASVVQGALEEVLIKVSGSSALLQEAEVIELVSAAEQYLAEFSYAENELSEVSGDSADTAGRYRLQMRFDSRSVMQVLNSARVPVWGSNRPSTIVWLAIESANGRFIMNKTSNPLLAEIMSDEASRRGLPVKLPEMTAEERQNISVSDIWGQFSDRIQAASSGYNADVIFSGRMYREASGTWQARWIMIEEGSRKNYSLSSSSLRTLFAESVDTLADQLASQYAVNSQPGKTGAFSFRVKGLESIEDYARLNRYLNSLQITENVQVTELNKSVLGYKVLLKGSSEQFISLLKLDSYLKLDETSVVNNQPDFIWQQAN
ncbi:DUF2066 domain-containing protein [Oceanospirillum sediminis]|uniref:DUF2066 domain-containing protein n=1 Tax=Oceanospirillum sediminis TaxID=2760088 RepID=A0A839IRD2_9GAMM|nr:DUF2066 domain-containing protein [Oceanospirillum sediminis]MBB1488043.1 DUF2066 domain-containing protein [Oceanospirillum sediminis]